VACTPRSSPNECRRPRSSYGRAGRRPYAGAGLSWAGDAIRGGRLPHRACKDSSIPPRRFTHRLSQPRGCYRPGGAPLDLVTEIIHCILAGVAPSSSSPMCNCTSEMRLFGKAAESIPPIVVRIPGSLQLCCARNDDYLLTLLLGTTRNVPLAARSRRPSLDKLLCEADRAGRSYPGGFHREPCPTGALLMKFDRTY